MGAVRLRWLGSLLLRAQNGNSKRATTCSAWSLNSSATHATHVCFLGHSPYAARIEKASMNETRAAAVRTDTTLWHLEFRARERARMGSPISPSLASPDSGLISQVNVLALKVSASSLLLQPQGMRGCVKDTNSCATETGKRPARFTKVAVGMESSDDEFGSLEDERCIDKGALQNPSLLHELVVASNDIPLRPFVSLTLLTQSDW